MLRPCSGLGICKVRHLGWRFRGGDSGPCRGGDSGQGGDSGVHLAGDSGLLSSSGLHLALSLSPPLPCVHLGWRRVLGFLGISPSVCTR